MNIKDMTVKNSFIELNNISMDFDNPGIYVIKGKVGCGKTTLIETILYGHEKIIFDDEKEAKLYREDRASLFSYMSQYRSSIPIKTIDFIKRDNKNIDGEKLREYLERLDLDYSILNRKYDKLSGGEAIKIAFISTVLKNVPYIILDEPTNHIDDDSVDMIKEIITEVAYNHTVILISHDVRFNIDADVEYIIDNGIISTDKNNVISSDYKRDLVKIAFRPFGIVWKYTIKYNIFVLLFLCAAIGILLFIPNMYLIEDKFPEVCDLPKDKICVDPEDLWKFNGYDPNGMKFSDIKKIADMEGVKDIYIMDADPLFTDDIMCWSVPYNFSKDMMDYIQYSTTLRLVEGFYGEYPHDNEHEIALSRYNYEMLTGTKAESEADMIGQKVNLACVGIDEYFTVCGVIKGELLWYSYSDEYKATFIKYDPKNYDEVCEGIIKRRMKEGYSDETVHNIQNSILISVDSDNAEKVTKNLKREFPACNPSGYYDYIEYYNDAIGDFAKSAFSKNIIMVLFASVIMIIGNALIIRNNYRILREFENYYVDRLRISRAYLVRDVLIFLFGSSLGYIVDFILIKKWAEFNTQETGAFMIILSSVYLILLSIFLLTHYICRRSVRHEVTL